MLKLIMFLGGLGLGAAGAAGWLLGEMPTLPEGRSEWEVRLREVQARLEAAAAEGARAGEQTETRLRAELQAYRQGRASA
ncbi:MAG TPA: hypothetical protein VFB58_02350 [Chloroflexota bacterium]|nr:hypothetical protein [Chloroflexota bacterium]